MSVKVSISPVPSPTAVAQSRRDGDERKSQSPILVNERDKDNRLSRIAESGRKCNLVFDMPVKGKAKKKVSLSFDFNLGNFLGICVRRLREQNFKVSDLAKFKRDVVAYVLDGYPKKIRNLRLSLKIDAPKHPKEWQKINEIILRSLEEEANLTRLEMEKDGYVMYRQGMGFYEEMALEVDEEGQWKRHLFQQASNIQITFCATEASRIKNEEYVRYSIPTSSGPIVIEFIASRPSSATCSLDALTIDYKTDDSGKTSFSAEPGWDVRNIFAFRDKGLFEVHMEGIPNERLGFLHYNANLLKGFLPAELTYEQAYGENLVKNETARKDIEENLEQFLEKHCENFDKKVLYLLISYGTVERLNINDDIKRFLFDLYAKHLSNLLRVPLTNELIQNVSLFFYLHLKTNALTSKGPLSHKGLLRLYSNDLERRFAFVLDTALFGKIEPEPGKSADEAIFYKLRTALSADRNFAQICSRFIPDEQDLQAFFYLKFKSFDAFLSQVENLDLTPRKQAKRLLKLFSSRSMTLFRLGEDQRAKLANKIIDLVRSLKDKETAIAFSLLKEAITHNVLKAKDKEELVLELVKYLYTQEKVKDAEDLCLKAAADPDFSIKAVFDLLQEIKKPSSKDGILVEFLLKQPKRSRKLILFLKEKDLALSASFFKEACARNLLVVKEKEELAKDLVKTLYSQNLSHEAEDLCLSTASDPSISFETLFALFDELKESSANSDLLLEFLTKQHGCSSTNGNMFASYNTSLLHGHLPTSLAFEQAYGEFLAKNESAIKEVEESTEKFVNGHNVSFDQKVLYLLNCYGTLCRLPIDDKIKDRLLASYENALSKILRIPVNKDLIGHATFFFYIQFKTFSDPAVDVQTPLSKKYGTTELTRLYKDGDKRFALVLDTTLLTDEEAVKGKVRKALRTDENFAQFCSRFIPERDNLLNLLKRKEKPSEFADFDAFLTQADRLDLNANKQAKDLIRLFSTKADTLQKGKDDLLKRLEKKISEVVFSLKDKEKVLAVSLFKEACSHKVLGIKEREKQCKALVKSLFILKDHKEAESIALNAALDPEISFETSSVLFEELYKSSSPWILVNFLNRIGLNEKKLKVQLTQWQKTLNKIKSLPSSHSSIVAFFRDFASFCNKCNEKKLLEEVGKRSGNIVDTAISLLKTSNDKESLLWCYQVQKHTEFAFLEPLAKVCSDLIQAALAQKDDRNVPLYLGARDELLKGDKDRFLQFFTAFVKVALPCKEEDASCLAIQKGIDHIVHKGLPLKKARAVFTILSGFSPKVLPESLKTSMEFLDKYSKGKKVDKLAIYTPEGFKQIKERFTKSRNVSLLDQSITAFRILRDETKDKDTLHSIHIGALELFEEALKEAKESSVVANYLRTLSSLFKYDGWSESEKQRLIDCQLKLVEILKPPSKKDDVKASEFDIHFKDLSGSDDKFVKEMNENFKLEMQCNADPNNPKKWRKLLELYITQNDSFNIIRIAERLLPLITKKNEKGEIFRKIAVAHNLIGDLKPAIAVLEKAISIDPDDPKTIYYLGICYIHNQEWDKAISCIKKIKKNLLNGNVVYIRALRIAEACAASRFDEAIPLLTHQNEVQDVRRHMLVAALHFKLAKKENESGVSYNSQRISLAIAYYEKALNLYYQREKNSYKHQAEICLNLGNLLLIQNRKSDAAYYLEKYATNTNDIVSQEFWRELTDIYFETTQWYKYITMNVRFYSDKTRPLKSIDLIKLGTAILRYIETYPLVPSSELEKQIQMIKAALYFVLQNASDEIAVKEVLKKYKKLLDNTLELFKASAPSSSHPDPEGQREVSSVLMGIYYNELAAVCYREKHWQLGIQLFQCATFHVEENNHSLATCFARIGRGYFHLSQWHAAFTNISVSFKMDPDFKELDIFFNGLGLFLLAWNSQRLSPLLESSIKNAIQECTKLLSGKELFSMPEEIRKHYLKFISEAVSISREPEKEIDPKPLLKLEKKESEKPAAGPMSLKTPVVVSKAEIAELEEQLKTSPKDIILLKKLHNSYVALNDHKNAIRTGEAFLPLLDNKVDILIVLSNLANAYTDLGHWKKGIALLEDARKINDKDRNILFCLAYCYVNGQEWQNAINSLMILKTIVGNVAFDKNPNMVQILNAAQAGAASRFEEAILFLETPGEIPNFGRNFLIGSLLCKIGKFMQALPFLDKAKKMDKDEEHPDCFRLLGEVYFNLSNWYPAVWHYAKVLTRSGTLSAEEILKMKFAILAFIDHCSENILSPSEKQMVNVCQTLDVLMNKVQDKALIKSLMGYRGFIVGLMEMQKDAKENSLNDITVKTEYSEFFILKDHFFKDLCTVATEQKLWSVKIDFLKKLIEMGASKEAQELLYASIANVHFQKHEWEMGFSVLSKHCRRTPPSLEIIKTFIGGLAMFLGKWETQEMSPQVGQTVKPLIEEYITFIGQKNLHIKAFGFENLLPFLKKFLSADLYASIEKAFPKKS